VTEEPVRVLVVDDQRLIRDGIASCCRAAAGHRGRRHRRDTGASAVERAVTLEGRPSC
jgi:hypothetical protein